MKKKWLKKLVALSTAALMMLGTVSVMAAEEGEVKPPAPDSVSVADKAYYKRLIDPENPSNAPDKATIQVTKKADASPGDFAGKDGIAGVRFGIAKIGDLAQIVDGNNTIMAYAIDKTFADTINLAGDYADYKYVYVEKHGDVNKAIKTAYDGSYDNSDENVQDTLEEMKLIKEYTNEDGIANFGERSFGLYLIVETDISKATIDGEPITITRKQYPFVVAAPYYVDGEDGGWQTDIDARAKNDTGTADLTKEIVRGYDGTTGDTIDNENLADSDVTEVGDVVEFKLTSTVPDMTGSAGNAKVDKYEISDNLSTGLTLPKFSAANMVIKDELGKEYVFGSDYTVNKSDSVISDNEANIIAGTSFVIKFKETGLAKLTDLAKDKNITAREVYVYYTATVNKGAVVGEDGNPNEARLEYSVGGGNTVTTEWDEVWEYIFSINAVKKFDGNGATENLADAITFKLFRYGENNEKIYQKVTGTAGNYVYDKTGTTKGATEELKLAADGSLYIKGAPSKDNDKQITLYLEETATAPGYNLLKEPVELVLVPAADDGGEYSGKLAVSSKVNGQAANLTDTEDGIEFTVNNTSGFQLPATGGMGARIFAIVGVFVIAAGVVFYVATRRKKA